MHACIMPREGGWGLLVLHGDQKEEIVFKWAVSGYLVKACKQSNSKKKILSNILA
jgi:hypothetical protein